MDMQGLNLLLVEDNLANQMVATMMLEHGGHRVLLASNGREALEKLAHTAFDAVLMDCQMPELDGFETTRRIRAGEVPGLNPRVPVIALTARAMASDRAACLAAGMDDYISKPIDPAVLQVALARCGLSNAVMVSNSVPTTPGVSSLPVIDPVHLAQLQQLRKPGGKSVAEEIAGLFVREMPMRLHAMSDLIAACRGPELGRAAHTLAGSCASMGAKRMRELVSDLEEAAGQGEWERVSARFASIQSADVELREELSRLKLIS